MKSLLFWTLLLASALSLHAQVGIGTATPNTNAILHLEANDKGFLLPRLTDGQATTLAGLLGPADAGMIIYNTTQSTVQTWNGSMWDGGGGGMSLPTATLAGDMVYWDGLAWQVSGTGLNYSGSGLVISQSSAQSGLGITQLGTGTGLSITKDNTGPGLDINMTNAVSTNPALNISHANASARAVNVGAGRVRVADLTAPLGQNLIVSGTTGVLSTLPDGANGQVLRTDGTGGLSWGTLRGLPTGTVTGEFLYWNGTAWTPTGTSFTTSTGGNGFTFFTSSSIPTLSITQLGTGQGISLTKSTAGTGINVSMGDVGSTDPGLLINHANTNAPAIRVTAGRVEVTQLASAAGNELVVANTSGQLFPLADGTNGQFLTTDGTGGLSWGTPTTGVPTTAALNQTLRWDGAAWTATSVLQTTTDQLLITSNNNTDFTARINNGGSQGSLLAYKPAGATTGSAASFQTLESTNASPTVEISRAGPGNALQVATGSVQFSPLASAAGNQILVTNTTGALSLQPDGTNGQFLTTDGSGGLSWAGLPAWGLTGNAGTTPGTNYIGTSDAQNLEMHVNSTGTNDGDGRVMQFQFATTSPSIVGGYKGNSITSSQGSAIAGGGLNGSENVMTGSDYSFIGAGQNNTMATGGTAGIVAGATNRVDNADGSFIGAGANNLITQNFASGIVAGDNNVIGTNGTYGFIGAGAGNRILGNSGFGFIGSGDGSRIDNGSRNAFIGAAQGSVVGSGAAANSSVIITGDDNTLDGNYSFIGTGDQHLINNSYAAILTGSLNTAIGTYSTVLNGDGNSASGDFTTILGGNRLELTGDYALGYNASGTAVSVPDGNIAYLGDVDLWLANADGSTPQAMRYYVGGPGSAYSSFRSRASQPDIINYLWPVSPPVDGQVMVATNNAGNVELDWATLASPFTETGTTIYNGTNKDFGLGTNSPGFGIDHQRFGPTVFAQTAYSAGAGPNNSIQLRSSRGGFGSNAAVIAGEEIGSYEYWGNTGTGFFEGASLRVLSTQTWAATTRGTSMQFNTTRTGQSSPATRMIIDGQGQVGVGTTTPNAGFTIGGSHSINVTLTGAAIYNVASTDYVIMSNGGGTTVVLPPASSATIGRMLIIKKTSGTGQLTIDRNGASIDFSASNLFVPPGVPPSGVDLGFILVQTSASNWEIVSSYKQP